MSYIFYQRLKKVLLQRETYWTQNFECPKWPIRTFAECTYFSQIWTLNFDIGFNDTYLPRHRTFICLKVPASQPSVRTSIHQLGLRSECWTFRTQDLSDPKEKDDSDPNLFWPKTFRTQVLLGPKHFGPHDCFLHEFIRISCMHT